MKTQTTPVQVKTAYGALFIAVAAADRHSYHDMERGSVTDLRPELWVASDPEFEADPAAEQHWTIRGRSYGVHYHVILEDRRDGRWHRHHAPYAGGFRNDRRGPVEFGTKTFDLMWDAVTTALDNFAASHPGWEDVSRYLLHANDARAAEFRAAEARKEAEQHEAAAAEHRARAERFAAAVKGGAISLTG